MTPRPKTLIEVVLVDVYGHESTVRVPIGDLQTYEARRNRVELDWSSRHDPSELDAPSSGDGGIGPKGDTGATGPAGPTGSR